MNAPRRRGTVLIVAMLVSFALASLVLALCRSMRAENLASANEAAALQADAVERGAEQYILAMLDQEGEEVVSLPENNFAAVPVGDGFFWVLRPQYDEADMPVFGLTPESAKVNINTANFDQISLVPGMDYTAASSIMDWKDEDNRLERDGAESDYYLGLPEPYFCKNSDFETVEELLMVRGVTREMLYGIPGAPPPLGERSTIVVRDLSSLMLDSQLELGLFDLFTVYSRENNTNAEGERRSNIGNNDRGMRRALHPKLLARLPKHRADRIITAIGTSDMNDIFEFYRRAEAGARITPEEFDLIADDLTTVNSATLRGRININHAPRAVLLALTGLSAADVDKLIAARPPIGTSSESSRKLSWIIEAIGAEKAARARLGTQITTRMHQWTADILAVSGNGRAFKRCRIVVDTQSGTPRITYRRDLTQRGWPMDTRILASIRAGEMQNNSSRIGVVRG